MGVRNNKTLNNSWAPVKRKRLKKPTMKCHSLGETIGAEKRAESGTVTSEWASRALEVKPTPRKIRRSQDPVFLNLKLTYRILYTYFKQYGKQSIGGDSLFYFTVFMKLSQMFRMGGLNQPNKEIMHRQHQLDRSCQTWWKTKGNTQLNRVYMQYMAIQGNVRYENKVIHTCFITL